MPRTPFHAGLDASSVIETAAVLTRESHLLSWSIRDLAARLGVAPSVIYHHVGGKDQLCRGIAQMVWDLIVQPEAELDWKGWYRSLLHSMYEPLIAHPGISQWTLTAGPTFQSAAPVVQNGIGLLERANISAPWFAFNVIFNTGLTTIATFDDRVLKYQATPSDTATMRQHFRSVLPDSPQARIVSHRSAVLSDPTSAEAIRLHRQYYDSAVETIIAGIEARYGK